MREISYLNVTFVRKLILLQFMKERSHINVTLLRTISKLKNYIALDHEGKKLINVRFLVRISLSHSYCFSSLRKEVTTEGNK